MLFGAVVVNATRDILLSNEQTNFKYAAYLNSIKRGNIDG
jgi:hypothetical protein